MVVDPLATVKRGFRRSSMNSGRHALLLLADAIDTAIISRYEIYVTIRNMAVRPGTPFGISRHLHVSLSRTNQFRLLKYI